MNNIFHKLNRNKYVSISKIYKNFKKLDDLEILCLLMKSTKDNFVNKLFRILLTNNKIFIVEYMHILGYRITKNNFDILISYCAPKKLGFIKKYYNNWITNSYIDNFIFKNKKISYIIKNQNKIKKRELKKIIGYTDVCKKLLSNKKFKYNHNLIKYIFLHLKWDLVNFVLENKFKLGEYDIYYLLGIDTKLLKIKLKNFYWDEEIKTNHLDINNYMSEFDKIVDKINLKKISKTYIFWKFLFTYNFEKLIIYLINNGNTPKRIDKLLDLVIYNDNINLLKFLISKKIIQIKDINNKYFYKAIVCKAEKCQEYFYKDLNLIINPNINLKYKIYFYHNLELDLKYVVDKANKYDYPFNNKNFNQVIDTTNLETIKIIKEKYNITPNTNNLINALSTNKMNLIKYIIDTGKFRIDKKMFFTKLCVRKDYNYCYWLINSKIIRFDIVKLLVNKFKINFDLHNIDINFLDLESVKYIYDKIKFKIDFDLIILNLRIMSFHKNIDDFVCFLIEKCDKETNEKIDNLIIVCINNNLIKSVKLLYEKYKIEVTNKKVIEWLDKINYYNSYNIYEILEFILDLVIKHNYTNINHLSYLKNIMENMEYTVFDNVYERYNKYFNYKQYYTSKSINEQIISYTLFNHNLKYIKDKLDIKFDIYNFDIYCKSRNPYLNDVLFFIKECNINKITRESYNIILTSNKNQKNLRRIKKILKNYEIIDNYVPDANNIPDNLGIIELNNFDIPGIDIDIDLVHIINDDNIQIGNIGNEDTEINKIIKEEMKNLK